MSDQSITPPLNLARQFHARRIVSRRYLPISGMYIGAVAYLIMTVFVLKYD
jgi:hypothetical protein